MVMMMVTVMAMIMMVMEQDGEESVVRRGWYLLHACAMLQ